MKYHQRDIVEISFLFPDGTFKPHPAIIVSRSALPLCSSKNASCRRTRTVCSSNIERDVQRRLGSIKQEYFDEIVDKIIGSIF